MAPLSWQARLDRALEPAPEQQAVGAVCLEAGTDTITLLRLSSGVPECVRVAAKNGQVCAVVQEPGAATAWVPRNLLPRSMSDLKAKDGAEEVKPGVGYCALKVGRAGSGKAGLKLPAAPGSAGMLCALLAEVSVDARLLSAFGTEVLLIPEEAMPRVATKLVSNGHALWPSTRICDPRPWEANGERPSDPELNKQLAGAWSLVQREEPPGTVVEEFTDGDGPLRLQVPGGLFIELRVPPGDDRGDLKQHSFGGRCNTVKKDGQIVCSQLRAIDFQPPAVDVPQFQVTLSPSCLEVVGKGQSEEYRELWAKLGTAEEKNFVALELQSEVPEPKSPRCGIWLFTGTRFARLVGLPRGGGLVAGTSCRSLGQLQRLRGYAEVRYELREQYEAVYGTVEEPGLLKTKRMAWKPEKTDEVFYSSTDESTGEIVVGQDSILHILPGGRRETWRIVEWTFDPFTAPAGSGGKAKSRSSSPTQARSHSSAKGSAKDEKELPSPEVRLRSESNPASDAEEPDAEKRSRSKSRSGSRSKRSKSKKAKAKAASEDGEKQAGEEDEVATERGSSPSRVATKTPSPEPTTAASTTRAKAKAKAPKEAKEGKAKEKKKKKGKKKDDAASDNGKKKKKKKAKKEKKEDKKADDDEEAAQSDVATELSKSPAPASAPASPKPAAEATSAPASPAAEASDKASPGRKSSAPASPAAASEPGSPAKDKSKSRSKSASSSAAATKKKKGRGARNELAAASRKKSKERGRKKDKDRKSSPKRKSSRSKSKRASSRKRDKSSKRSPSRKRGRSGSRKGSSSPKRSRSRSRSKARNKARSKSGRRGGRGGRSRSRSRSDRKKRRK